MADGPITKAMHIGEVIDNYPETKGVFLKYFGDGCFTCPGARMEDIAFGSGMHSVDPDIVVTALNKAIEDAAGGEVGA